MPERLATSPSNSVELIFSGDSAGAESMLQEPVATRVWAARRRPPRA